jgi:arsenate reductase
MQDFYPELRQYLSKRTLEFNRISKERKAELAKVTNFIRQKIASDQPAKLTFICTHNSRRSHLSQIWAQAATAYYNLQGVETFSGGTEATAFNPRAVAALRRCGLKIVAEDSKATNPRYIIHTSDSSDPMVCFSKVYDEAPNPKTAYCAVMTCSQADEACPLVKGCELRVPIRYEDPKVADDTALESQKYDERSAEICTEMLYMMSGV